jgi:hypothetical protein
LVVSVFIDPREEDMKSAYHKRQNIIRYLQQLQVETDLEKKRMLLRLVGEEQAEWSDEEGLPGDRKMLDARPPME